MEPLLTYDEVTGWLKSQGAVRERSRGTHEQWRLPSRARVTVPVPHGAAGRKAWERHLAFKRWRTIVRLLNLGG